ncbi:MAG: hypothetical protein JOZ47_04535 [Kutzneria sp.]|nr:hypothetical protein [Kutzneria sp.]
MTRPRNKRPRGQLTSTDVFGQVLPDTTRDEREPDDSGSNAEEWYRENRPPHHEDRE